eukprot:SAG31_NODE_43607_length_266_cov_0.910180_1_plen_34_part_01
MYVVPNIHFFNRSQMCIILRQHSDALQFSAGWLF